MKSLQNVAAWKRRGLLLSAGVAAMGNICATAVAEEVFADEVIVTGNPASRAISDTVGGVSLIDHEELQQRASTSLGELLRHEPGISSSFFGPAASRPIIRGLGGDRIRVLDAGIGSIDASAASPDHATAIEPAMAERVEILRGPATLLYGSSAAGGVVNVFSGKIPDTLPEDGVDGALRIGGSTVDEGLEAAGGANFLLSGGEGDISTVLHLEGFYRDADDYRVPSSLESAALIATEDPEEHEEHEEEETGKADNSAYKTFGGTAGLSFLFDDGFVGFSFSSLDSDYGVPGGHAHGEHEDEEHDDEDHDDDDHDDHDDDDDHDHEEEHAEEEGGITIALKQRRFDMRGEVSRPFTVFRQVKWRFGYADYEHQEIEPNGEIGTTFTNEGYEGRLEFLQQQADLGSGVLNGAVGLQWRHRDFAALGEEAFTPPSETRQIGLFTLQDWAVGGWRFDLGARYEETRHRLPETMEEQSYQGVSVSAGVSYRFAPPLFLGVTAARTERAPSIEELFSDGAHLATQTFERGDRTLEEEVAINVETTLRYESAKLAGEINLFYTDYDGFIFQASTGEEEDELPVLEFQAGDAVFKGIEAKLEAEIAQLSSVDIHADVAVDVTRARLKNGANRNLPRIPPLNVLAGLEAKAAFASLRFEVEHAAAQNNIAAFELPTEAYTMFHMFARWQPVSHVPGLNIRLAAKNLTNEEARLHSSYLKDLLPLPGRNISVSLHGSF